MKVTDDDEFFAKIQNNDNYNIVIPTKAYAVEEYPTKSECKHLEMLPFEGT